MRLTAALATTVLAALGSTACGAGVGDTGGGAAAPGSPGGSAVTGAASPSPAADTADCPLPPTPAPPATASLSAGAGTATAQVSTVTATVGSIAGGSSQSIGTLPGATGSSSTAASTVPGRGGIPLPSRAASVSAGDVRVAAASGIRAVAVHRGAHVALVYDAAAAVLPIDDTDSSVLRDDGRSCNADGGAVRTFTAVSEGMSVLLLQLGPRCLNARPFACLPAVAEVAFRVDVVP